MNSLVKVMCIIFLVLSFHFGNAQLSCTYSYAPDLPLLPTDATIVAEIDYAISKYSDFTLGTTPPTSSALNNAINQYNSYNITIGSDISGNTIATFSELDFLKVFAQHLKHNPSDAAIAEMANNIIWLAGKQHCDGSLATDLLTYYYRDFVRPAVLLRDHVDDHVASLFRYMMYKHTWDYRLFWSPTYEHTDYLWQTGSINTDAIHNISDALLAYVLWYDTPDEQYRYMSAYQRWMERFLSYSSGTGDGIKPDGSGFHHYAAFDAYMYAFSTAARDLYFLDGTRFQVTDRAYKVLRDGIAYRFTISHDEFMRPLGLAGRHPHIRYTFLERPSIKLLVQVSGNILGISGADPELASLYNRQWGADSSFGYSTLADFREGFFQFNHSTAGIYRQDDWVATMRGFSDGLWGAEISSSSNRFGRYQSYGTLEIVYPGNELLGNGFDDDTWNWNHYPGATSINLPWSQLVAEWPHQKELQVYDFAGSLAFKNRGSEMLNKIHGTYGVFGMKFQEKQVDVSGWPSQSRPDSHNSTFTFRKSMFTIDNMIVCLGSGISNNDNQHETITTLYQRKTSSNYNTVVINGITLNGNYANNYNTNDDNWLISNYNTGFYIIEGSGLIRLSQGDQKTPLHTSNSTNTNARPVGNYAIGYLDHGASPSQEGFEYMVFPNATSSSMNTISTQVSAGDKSYIVERKDNVAHVIQVPSKNIWGYSIFEPYTRVSEVGPIVQTDTEALIMLEQPNCNSMTMAVTNPELNLAYNDWTPSIDQVVQVTLDGNWNINQGHPDASIVSNTSSQTTIRFLIKDALPLEIDLYLITNANSCNDYSVSLRAMLCGYMDNNQMDNQLYSAGLLPQVQPFNTSPWNYTGTENVSSIVSDVVDWVLLIIRDTIGNPIETKAALLKQNGSIVDVQGNASLSFAAPVSSSSYHISIHSRNHLAIISADPIDNNTSFDFTTSIDQAQGNTQQDTANGVPCMYAGDYNADGVINSLDFNLWKTNAAANNQYISIDGDGSGVVNNLDYNLWYPNRSKIGEPTIRY